VSAVTFQHSDRGTDESVWRRHTAGVTVVHVADILAVGRTVVVAPHPDDETLGAGGLVASLSAAGTEVRLVICTDGEAAAGLGSVDSMRAIGSRRRAEAEGAAAVLATGSPVELCFLELPDGDLAGSTVELEAALAPLLADAEMIVAPWPGDGHPDHAAVGRAVRRISGATPRLDYPVWAWHWGAPENLPDGDLVRVPLSPSAQRAKGDAIQTYVSQLSGVDPILTPAVLAHFRRDHELFVIDTATRSAIRPVDRSSSTFFDSLYHTTPGSDPWDFARSETERTRFDQLVDHLGGLHFRSGLELGCSTGQLTRRLARHTDRVLAIDTSARAIEVAASTLDTTPNVELRVGHLPEGLRTEDVGFDLVVLAELGYYFSVPELTGLVQDLARRSTAGATLLASHWTGSSSDHRLDARTTHRVIDNALGWPITRTAVLGDHLIDVWTRA